MLKKEGLFVLRMIAFGGFLQRQITPCPAGYIVMYLVMSALGAF